MVRGIFGPNLTVEFRFKKRQQVGTRERLGYLLFHSFYVEMETVKERHQLSVLTL